MEMSTPHGLSEYLQNHRIHLIGNAHIDPVWLWRWTDGFSEVKATFLSAVDRLNEYPGFVFTCAGACYYQWVEANCPELFHEIQRLVASGRWVPVNGWWIQPDCNLPCGESFARQSLYGQRYYLEKFGLICNTGYNVDSFGHNGMLPQIMRQSGMTHYVFMRPSDQEKPGLQTIFRWESADGSQVLTYRLPAGYGHKQPDLLLDKISEVAKSGELLDSDMMFFYGVGNHGGGPTIALLDQITALQQDLGKDRLVFSSPVQYMADIEPDAAKYPVVRGDLHHHAIGCYSANLQIKQSNRLAENRLLCAERLNSLAYSLFTVPDHTSALKAAWEKVMFNQFHDILCGCSIKPAYQDAAELHGYALCVAGDVQNQATQKIAWAVDTIGDMTIARSKENNWRFWNVPEKGTPVVIFNPLAFAVTVPVAVFGDLTTISDSDNRSLPIQRIRGLYVNGETDKWQTVMVASLPALGYATFWLHQQPSAAETVGLPSLPTFTEPAADTSAAQWAYTPVQVAADAGQMANDYVIVVFNTQSGCLADLIDRQTGRHLINRPAAVGLVIDESSSDTWGHGLREYRDVIGSFHLATITVLESGPLRGVVRVVSRYQESMLTQDFILYADRPDIEVLVRVLWQEKHKMLKLEFPINLENAQATAEIPYGFAPRPADGSENPIQQWVDLSNDADGVAIINDASFAADVKDSILRLTVLRSPGFADHYGNHEDLQEFMDQGLREVRYQICPHAGNWRAADIVRKAMVFNNPPIVNYETYHHGPLPLKLAGIEVKPANIIVTVLKIAESRQGYMLRAYETSGQTAAAEICLPTLERAWQASFGPCEIKTILIPFDRAEGIRETNLLELSAAEMAGGVFMHHINTRD